MLVIGDQIVDRRKLMSFSYIIHIVMCSFDVVVAARALVSEDIRGFD